MLCKDILNRPRLSTVQDLEGNLEGDLIWKATCVTLCKDILNMLKGCPGPVLHLCPHCLAPIGRLPNPRFLLVEDFRAKRSCDASRKAGGGWERGEGSLALALRALQAIYFYLHINLTVSAGIRKLVSQM